MWDKIYSTEWTNLVAMVPLLLCSIITVGIILERLLNFRPRAIFSEALSDDVIGKISAGNWREALKRSEEDSSLQSLLIQQGIRDRFEKNVLPEVAFLDHGMSQLGILAKWVPVLNFIAKVAPLLGLLGTVLGMIEAFEVISASSAGGGEVRPDEVAKGIGTALLTTAAGLMVAIPALVTGSILTRIGEKIYTKFEDSLSMITIACGGLRIENPLDEKSS